MLKPQDCIILVKLLANPTVDWSQRQLAKALCISLAEVNGGIKRLGDAGLLRKGKQGKLYPNIDAAEEFLISGVKFFFPGKLGEYTRGMPTGVVASIFHDKIALGNDPIPVCHWRKKGGRVTSSSPKRIVILTPVPPFQEACMYLGKVSDKEWLPYVSSKVVGDVLMQAAQENLSIEFLVFSGHTHSEENYQPLSNLTVKAGKAEYGRPE